MSKQLSKRETSDVRERNGVLKVPLDKILDVVLGMSLSSIQILTKITRAHITSIL